MSYQLSDWDDNPDWSDSDSEHEPPPGPTASELIQADVDRALRKLKNLISDLTAKHLYEFRSEKLAKGFLRVQHSNEDKSWSLMDAYGNHVFVPRYCRQTVKLQCTRQTFEEHFEDRYAEPINLEKLGYGGEWFIKSVSRSDQCCYVDLERINNS